MRLIILIFSTRLHANLSFFFPSIILDFSPLNASGVLGFRHKTKLLEYSFTTPEERRIERARRVVERFNHDADFQFLHNCVSDLFAQQLRLDMEMLKLGELNNLSSLLHRLFSIEDLLKKLLSSFFN